MFWSKDKSNFSKIWLRLASGFWLILTISLLRVMCTRASCIPSNNHETTNKQPPHHSQKNNHLTASKNLQRPSIPYHHPPNQTQVVDSLTFLHCREVQSYNI